METQLPRKKTPTMSSSGSSDGGRSPDEKFFDCSCVETAKEHLPQKDADVDEENLQSPTKPICCPSATCTNQGDEASSAVDSTQGDVSSTLGSQEEVADSPRREGVDFDGSGGSAEIKSSCCPSDTCASAKVGQVLSTDKKGMCKDSAATTSDEKVPCCTKKDEAPCKDFAAPTSDEKEPCCSKTKNETCKDSTASPSEGKEPCCSTKDEGSSPPTKATVAIAIKEDPECEQAVTSPPPPGKLSRVATTKLRVQNICCALEGKLVKDTLEPLDGVASVSVNVVGRVAYVRHVAEKISAAEIVNVLNDMHLGVSIMETGARGKNDQESGLPRSLKLLCLYAALQTVVMVTAATGFFLETSWYKWVAIAETILGSAPILRKSFYSVKMCKLDINILMLIAVGGTLAIQQWIEGAIVVFVYSVAEVLEQFCLFKVQRTISGLMLEAPQMAVLAGSGEFVHVNDIAIGTVIAVRPGDLVALDGVVVKGQAAVDESSISGESVPVEKNIGGKVWSGTVNQNGYLEVKTTADASSSTVSKVADMVEEAQASSTQTEVVINRFAKCYTPLVVIIAVLIVAVPAILGASGVGTYRQHIADWAKRALFLLVVACPCALVMATPIATVCGITASARNGALVKGAVHLETLARLQTLGFDKTGTLTEGLFTVTDVECPPGVDEYETMSFAAAIESKTSHPIAAAIVHKFSGCVTDMVLQQTVTLPPVSRFKLHEGRGISGHVNDRHVKIGNYDFLRQVGGVLPERMEELYAEWSHDSKTVVFVCVDGTLAMMMSLADSIRPSSLAALEMLREIGVQTTMITGDNAQTAKAVGAKLGLDECISQMKPREKLSWIEDKKRAKISATKPARTCPAALCCDACPEQKAEGIVGMVGDGINDGPALAAANVGIAMGAGGTALAVESADVALMSNNLKKIPQLVLLGRFCRTVVRQNIVLAVVPKILIVGVALAGMAELWMAVLADVLALLLVILNGLRPLWRRGGEGKEDEVYVTKKDPFYYTKVSGVDEEDDW